MQENVLTLSHLETIKRQDVDTTKEGKSEINFRFSGSSMEKLNIC